MEPPVNFRKNLHTVLLFEANHIKGTPKGHINVTSKRFLETSNS